MPPKKKVAKNTAPKKKTPKTQKKNTKTKKEIEDASDSLEFSDSTEKSGEDSSLDLSFSESEDKKDDDDSLNMDYGDDDKDDESSLDESNSTEEPKDLDWTVDLIEKDEEERIVLTGNDRVMCERVTIFELANIVSTRAAQIENGSAVFVKIKEGDTPKSIATHELKKNVCPLKIMRHSHSNVYEEWRLSEMIIPWDCSGMIE